MPPLARICLTLTAVALSLSASQLQAATTTYTDRLAFDSAVSALGDTLDTVIPGGTTGFLPGPTYPTNLSDYGVSIDGVGFLNPDAALGSGPSGGPVTLDGGVLQAGHGISPLQVTLPDDTYAVGYDLRYVNEGPDFSFYGMISDTPVKTFTIDGHPGSSNSMQVKNFSFGPSSLPGAGLPSVPEPGTLALFGLGLAAVMPVARRRRPH